VTGALSAHQFTISTSLTSALQARAAQLDVSLFHLLLTAYLRRLADWSGDDTVTANVARSGRDARLPDIERLVGPFADTLPITVAVSGASDVGALARRVRGTWLDSERHAGVTTLDLARLLPTVDAAPRTAGTASFSFARFPIAAPPGCPVRVVATAARTGSAATRLGLVCWEFEGALQFAWNFPTQLFLPATIGRLTAEYVAELEGVVGPATVRPSVAQRIQAQCRRTPDAVAVDSGATALTYAQLDSSAQRLAARLRGHHIVAGDRVALLTTPGAATLTGLVGILYTGAAWVPLDAAHPVARLTDQVRRADVSVVVCDRSTRAVANRLGVAVVDLDTPPADQPSVDPDQSIVGPGDIAYVIFTSGTTGRPKGVPILHSAMAAYLDWAIATFGYCAGDRMLATASICFDASIRQLLAPLLVGATIVSTTRDGLRDPQALLTTVVCERVTVWSSVPTLWRQLLRAGERQVAAGESPDLSALRWVHVGGESLSPTHVRRWFDICGPGSRIVNLYGPTEATINATYDVIDERPGNEVTRLAIGRPVADTLIDVVGPTGASCGPGQPGELHLAGPALTPGYLDEPDLTAAAFVHRRGKRWYRTGDRVVLRPDGRLEFLGRTDRQVKVRGHRVELEEIETVLQQHPGVEGASVVEVPGQGRLIAYVQLEGPAKAACQTICGHILRRSFPTTWSPHSCVASRGCR
jgi:amino acid adenylation domain-containing protein